MKIGILSFFSRAWFVKNADFHGFHEFFNNLLVERLAVPAIPFIEERERRVVIDLGGGNLDVIGSSSNDFIDVPVVEAGRCSVVLSSGVVKRLDSCPMNSGKAHRARLARGVNLTIEKIEPSKKRRRPANCHDLRVGSRVLCLQYLVMTLREDNSVANDDRAERTSVARLETPAPLLNCRKHEAVHCLSQARTGGKALSISCHLREFPGIMIVEGR